VSRRPPGRGGSRDGSRGSPGATRIFGITFRSEELRDLGIAWVALSVAFAILFAGGGRDALALLSTGEAGTLGFLLVVSLLTAGLGFLLHELAHKVVAIRFGQTAVFKANYQMLGLGVMVALIGFIYAAPGAVYHAGRVSEREQGLVALAGPLTNVALTVVFVVPALGLLGGEPGLVSTVAVYGLTVNLLLAGFNMIPFGPLDGATVRDWSLTVYVVTGVPCLLLGVVGFILFGRLL
jgi:Zn-dependent protease